MVGPETRQGVSAFSAVSAPTRKVPAPVETPLKKQVPASPQPEKPKKPSWVRTKAGRIGLTIVGALGSIGVGAGVAHQINPNVFDRPTASQPAETIAPTITSKENLFPNTIDKSEFVPITQEQAVKELTDNNIADLETHTIKMFLPIDKETLDNSPNLKTNREFIATLPPYVDKTKLEGVKNIYQIDGLPDGTTVKLSVSGKLRVLKIAGQKRGTGSDSYIPSYSLAAIDLQDKDGKPLRINISVLGGEPLIDLSKASWESNGIEVKAGDEFFKISKANAMGGEAQLQEAGQITIQGFFMQQNPRAPIPLTVDFLKEIIIK